MHDERRWAPLIDANRHHLVRAATRLLGPADAEDAVQDAYIRALEASPQALDSAQAWLLTVVCHLAIDRLRRRHWLQQWQAECSATDGAATEPSAEMAAALADEVARALHLLATGLTPAEGAAVLLHAVFEATHAEMAQASGKTEAASRQTVSRALQKLQRQRASATPGADAELALHEETVFRLYLQSLQLRDAQTLWAMLRQPPIHAAAVAVRTIGEIGSVGTAAAASVAPPPSTSCSVVQIGGQLGLVLSLDGVVLCVLPLGVRTADCDATTALQ